MVGGSRGGGSLGCVWGGCITARTLASPGLPMTTITCDASAHARPPTIIYPGLPTTTITCDACAYAGPPSIIYPGRVMPKAYTSRAVP